MKEFHKLGWRQCSLSLNWASRSTLYWSHWIDVGDSKQSHGSACQMVLSSRRDTRLSKPQISGKLLDMRKLFKFYAKNFSHRVHFLSRRMKTRTMCRRFRTSVRSFLWMPTWRNSATNQSTTSRFMIIMTPTILPAITTQHSFKWKCNPRFLCLRITKRGFKCKWYQMWYILILFLKKRWLKEIWEMKHRLGLLFDVFSINNEVCMSIFYWISSWNLMILQCAFL